MTPELMEACKRALELLDATTRFMEANPIAAEYSVNYDEAQCDGQCLADDCLSAYESLAGLLAPLEGARNE